MLKTIKGRAYLFAGLIVSCAIIVILIIAGLFVDTEQQMNKLLTINSHVYDIQLEVSNFSQSFRRYSVTRNEEDGKEILEYADELHSDASSLRDEVFSRQYVREIDDLYNMVDTLVCQTYSVLENPQELSIVAEGNSVISYTSSLIIRYYDYVYIAMQEYYDSVHSSLSQRIVLLYAISAAAVIMFLAVALFVVRLLNLRVLAPFGRITKKAAEFRSDGTSFVFQKKDELLMLENAFDSMVERVQYQMDNVEERMQMELDLKQQKLEKARMERLLSETEAKALRARINPHFLYNTLNIIAQMAYIENAEKTELLIEAVSDYFRYNLKDLRELSTFKDEIQNIKDYAYIQKMRFGERFEFVIEYDSEADAVPVPAMVLQPIVENSIVHGYNSSNDFGLIRIEVRKVGDRINFSVTDNGCGIPQEIIDRILEQYKTNKKAKTHAHSIGLKNVISRLLACFHDELRIDISSAAFSETKIFFSVPILDPSLIEEASVYESEAV